MLADTERNKSGTSFITDGSAFDFFMMRKGQGEWGTTRTRTKYGLTDPVKGTDFSDIINRLVAHKQNY